MRGIYLAIGIAIIFFHLIPLETAPRRWAAPDIWMVITFVWVLRRPDYAPALSIAAITLLADFLFQRPPGLWAAMLVIGSQVLRNRADDMRNVFFSLEWITVSVVIVATFVVYHVMFAVVMGQELPVSLITIQVALTVLMYPVVVAISRFGFGVFKAAPGEVDALGRPL